LQGAWRNYLKEHSSEEIEAAKEYLASKKKYCTQTANWFVSSTEDWSKPYDYIYQPCHAALTKMGRGKYENVIALENGWKRMNTTRAKNLSRSLPFLSWFLYYSPYGEFILNRDDFEYCRDYGFIVSGELPHAVLMNIAIISRHFYEVNEDTFKRFNDLTLEKGFDPTIVYSLVFNTYFSYYDYGEKWLHKKYQGYSGHRVAYPYSPNVLVNLFNGFYGNNAVSKKMYQHNTTTGSSGLFTNNDDMTFIDWVRTSQDFQNSLRLWRKPDAKVESYKPPNPFVKVNPYEDNHRVLRPWEFTYEELFNFVIEYTDNLVRKMLKEKEDNDGNN